MRAKVWHSSGWVNQTDSAFTRHTLERMLHYAGFKVLDYIEYEFDPFGYTGLWLLAESHLAVHTFPEENKSYVELTSCNETKFETFIKQLADNFIVTKSEAS